MTGKHTDVRYADSHLTFMKTYRKMQYFVNELGLIIESVINETAPRKKTTNALFKYIFFSPPSFSVRPKSMAKTG